MQKYDIIDNDIIPMKCLKNAIIQTPHTPKNKH